MKMGTKERISEIEERMEKLRGMKANCYRIIGIYRGLNHRNSEFFARLYERNIERLKKEYEELESERKELSSMIERQEA